MRQLFSTLLLLVTVVSHGQHAMGLMFDDERYGQTRRLSPALKFSEGTVPVAYSLKSYCPKPGDQGQVGSCVGWSTGYGALSIAEAFRNKTTNKDDITNSARSAMYIYEQLMTACSEGIYIDQALDLVQKSGDCLSKEFDHTPCPSKVPATLHPKAAEFKIQDYYTLFDQGGTAEQKIIATRKSLLANKPVVIGMKTTSSLDKVKADGIWSPSPSEPIGSGHAVCVIGYDDQKKMFEILNSWGTGWGDNGFFKVSYDDYGKYCKYGYQFTLQAKDDGKEVKLTGNFKFKKYRFGTFEDAAVHLSGSEYTIEDVHVDDFFRIAASNVTADKFVYIFSIKPDNSAELLFPSQRSVDGATVKDLPVFPSNDMVLEIPTDPTKGITTDMAGNDALIILYSAVLIDDIDNVVRQVKNSSGDFLSRLQVALGDRLIPASDIKYSTNEMALTVKSKKGIVAPLILKVNVQK